MSEDGETASHSADTMNPASCGLQIRVHHVPAGDVNEHIRRKTNAQEERTVYGANNMVWYLVVRYWHAAVVYSTMIVRQYLAAGTNVFRFPQRP